MSPSRSRRKPRPSAIPVAADEIMARLGALARELRKRRWAAHVAAEPWRRPRLFVRHPTNPALCGRFLVAPDDLTGARFFWDEAEKPVALATAPHTAAGVIIERWTAGPDANQDPAHTAPYEITEPPLATPCGTCQSGRLATVRLIIPNHLVRHNGSDDALTKDRCSLCWDHLRTQLIAQGHTISDTTGSVEELRAEFPDAQVFRSDEGVVHACVNGATYHAYLARQLRERLKLITTHAVTTHGARHEHASP